MGSFLEKIFEKKHLCRKDSNYCYFWKSNIPVTNLIADSRNMIQVSINWINGERRFHQTPKITQRFYCL